MRILVYGAGVLGGNLANNLFRAKQDVTLGKICASDHAMNAVDEMRALNRDMKAYFEETGAEYPIWKVVEQSAQRYLV